MFQVSCFENGDLLAAHLAHSLNQEIQQPCPTNEPFAIMLAGGTTPGAAYDQLAESPPDVSHGVYFMLSDERVVPIDSKDSNFANMAPLFSALSVPQHRLMFVETDVSPEEAALQYAGEIEQFLELGGRLPLGFLGLGSDGHTASLFTNEDLERGANTYAVAVQRPDGRAGVSVTPKLLARFDKLVFVVSGESKRDVVETLCNQPGSITAGKAVAGHPNLHLWTDREAYPNQ